MKVVTGLVKYFFLLIFVFSGHITTAQLINDGELVKYIEVTGSAETAVVPDIITLSFTVKEYKTGKDINTLKELEFKLKSILKRLQIPDSSLFVDNIYGREV